MKQIDIDIETYSEAEIRKTGVYPYASHPSFEILIFGYAIDEGPVRAVDLAGGETIPDEILIALTDETITKWAHNSSFERVCLSAYLRKHYPQYFRGYGTTDDSVGNYLNPRSWKCSMTWGSYMGLPLSLKDIGSVLGLNKQKIDEGKDLIKYFCQPCKPTKTNNGRTRNFPYHAPEKWAAFKAYNKRDVEVEMGIRARLANFSVPDSIWEEFYLDQQINDRGIAVDMTLVKNAIALDVLTKDNLMLQMREKTGLENPNSVSQMKGWLANNGVKVESLDKQAVKELLPKANERVADVLSCRQQIAKSSVSKYKAMENCVCDDGRARGMFQFYGANRTGRWCLTGDHEVLTKTGWVRLDEWLGGSIACWSSGSAIMSFQKANSLCFDYEGPMYTYFDTRIDQCSTPDHKMRAKRSRDSEWQDMTVAEMATCCRPSFPFTGYKNYRCCADPAWFRVLIMTQADGYYTEDGLVRYHFKKIRKVERCKMLLRKAEIYFVERRHKDGSILIEVPSRSVPLWLRQFTDKTFGYWLFDENPDIFFEELPYWDGHCPAPNSIQYCTANKTNADIVQALAHISGRAAILREKKMRPNPKWSKSYIVDIWLNPTNSHEIINKPQITDYCGQVYCAETPTGYFLVRRNGKVWVTGNSGRNVQIQNLPVNHMADLAEARSLVRDGDFETLSSHYDNIPNVLSELIRTAFVPKQGYKYIVADFSAIEARVLSFLAGEQWRIDLFAEDGDIYCQSASEMFKVPVVKSGENGHLRQKGKIAELACIAEGQPVLTDRGLVPIEDVKLEDKVWDGRNWVRHSGVVYRGEKEVITYEGLTATPDHLVFIEGQDEPVQFGVAAANGAHLIRTSEKIVLQDTRQGTARVYDILNAGPNHRFTVSACLVHNCGYGGSVGALKSMGALEMGLTENELQPLVDAWRGANPNIVQLWWDIDEAVKNAVRYKISTNCHGFPIYCKSGMLFIDLPSGRHLSYVKPRIGINRFESEAVIYEGMNTGKWVEIESYGPKFVENIVQAVSRDILANAMRTLSDYFICGHVHDEIIIECDREVSVKAICNLMEQTPSWISGLLLKADGYECEFYRK